MTTPRGCDSQLVDLLGAFALDAVDEHEGRMVDQHLLDCPRCRAEVEQHREVAARLAFAGTTAPAGLWGRIAAELDPAEPEPDLGHLYPLRPSRRTPTWAVRTLVSAAAAILALFGALGWEVHTQGNRVQTISSAMAKGRVAQAAQAALLDPNAKTFNLTSLDGDLRVEAVIQPDGTGYLVPGAHGALPALPPTQTYQLWGIVGGDRISVGVLGPNPKLVAFRASNPKMVALAVTTEQAGGVVQSTHDPVVVGFVPSDPATATAN